MQPRYIALTVTALVVAAGGALYWFTQSPMTPEQNQNIDFSGISTTTTVGGYTIEPIPVNEVYRPDYTKPIVYSASVSVEVKAAIEVQFAKAKELLAKDPMDFNTWIDLGTIHKMAGDYKGAEAIWIYASKQWESDVAHANLGDLYLNFLKDKTKAAASFQAALALKPDNASYKAGLSAAQSR